MLCFLRVASRPGKPDEGIRQHRPNLHVHGVHEIVDLFVRHRSHVDFGEAPASFNDR